MPRTLIASSGLVTEIYRLNATGELELVKPDLNEYVTPPKGMRAKFQLSGISETFMMDSQYSTEPVEKVRLEYLIVKGSGNIGQLHTGKRFTELLSWKLSPTSSLGKLLGGFRGAPVQRAEELNPDDFIGTTFVSVTTANDAGTYAGINSEAIEAGSVTLPDTASAPPPSPNGTAPTVVDADGLDDDLDDADPFK